jgi:hypothetical protein
MDAEETWYINGGSIKINNVKSSKTVSLVKQSDRVVKVTENGREYYLYASRVANASFTGKVAGFDASTSYSGSALRSVAGGKGWVNVVVKDLDNGSSTTTTTDENGIFTVDDAIPGDDYQITPEGGIPTNVKPLADGDDIGTITIADGVNFKCRITGRNLDSSYNNDSKITDINMLCAKGWYGSPYYGSWLYSSNPSYNFVLSIQNTGNTDATAATYSLSLVGLQLTSGAESDILGTIEPKRSMAINISLRCSSDSITGDYAYKKIYITINDPINNRSWDDSVSLRFFKEIVPIIFTGSANGIVITPSGQTVRPISGIRPNTDYGGYLRGAIIPKLTTGEYLFAFSGATANSESAYSISFRYGNMIQGIPDQDGALGTDTARYEPNNTEDTATVITGGIHAYLHKNDIDYYKFHF